MDLTFDGARIKVTDQAGAVMVLDQAGRPVEWTPYENHKTKEKKDWLTLRRDPQGRVQAIETTWGYREQNVYDAQGRPQQIAITRGGMQEVIEFEAGRPTRVREFDGGEFCYSYYEEGPAKGRVREARLPQGLVLTCEYDGQGRLSGVACGDVYRLEYTYDDKGQLTALKQIPCGK
jgi:YD repeat-containing protein